MCRTKIRKKIMSKDDADMICVNAYQTLSEFCDDKSSFKDMPIINQARTAVIFFLMVIYMNNLMYQTD